MLSKPEFVIPSVNYILKGKNFLRYCGSVIWNSLPIEIMEDHSILSFVTKIKQWKQIVTTKVLCLLNLITTSKHLIKELKFLKIFGIFVLSLFNVYVPYLCRVTVS